MPYGPVETVVLWLLGMAATWGGIELGVAFIRIWGASRHGDEALQRAEVLTREGRIEDAVRVARRLPGPVSTVLVAGLSAVNEAEAEKAMADAAASERRRLSASIRLLDVVAAAGVVLPLVGLAIARFRSDATPGPHDLYDSLLVLALGLGTAILAVLGRFWVHARVRRIVVEMEKGAAVVYNTAR